MRRDDPGGVVLEAGELLITQPLGAWPFHAHGIDEQGQYVVGLDGYGSRGSRYSRAQCNCETNKEEE